MPSDTTVTIDADRLDQLADLPLHSVTLDGGTLTQALRAIIPHATDDPDAPHFNRIQLTYNTELRLTASNGHTAGLVRLPDLDDHSERPFRVDLLPADLAVVAKMFKPGKDETITVRIDVLTDQRVAFTDTSGLFDSGRAYTVPSRGGHDKAPNVPELIHTHLVGRKGQPRAVVEFTGDLLRRFATTAGAYTDALTVEPTVDNGPFIVRVGEHFIGLLMPRRYDDDRGKQLTTERDQWADRLI